MNEPFNQFNSLFCLARLALLTGALGLTGCDSKNAKPASPNANLPVIVVQVGKVQSQVRTSNEEVVGTVKARLQATLEAKVSGRIEKLPVVLGQRVKAGELIARLEAAELTARLESAEAALEQAGQDWKRISALFQQQSATRADYDAAQAQQRRAKATVAEARALLSYVEVLAPFDGVVTRKLADVGDFASPGKALASLEDTSSYQMEAEVPQALIPRIQAKSRLTAILEGLPAQVVGTVSEISPTVDPLSRTLRVKLDLTETNGLSSGQFARLLIPTGEGSSLRVASSAVVLRGQLEIVFVVENRQAKLRLVKAGRRLGDETEILSGLQDGEVVVNDAGAHLVDGQPVEAK